MTSPSVILNVDDVAAQRYAKSRVLKHAGYEVMEAGTGADALRLTAEHKPDLVLLDINLPDMSGLDVCRAIKASRHGARTPVLHISSTYVGDDDEMMCLEHGADVYLAEPVEPRTLVTLIGVLLRLRKIEAGLSESEERMRLATEAAGIATWDIDLDTDAAVWSEEFYRMLGYTPGLVRPSWSAWRACIHPADRERVVERMLEAQKGTSLFREEHRIVSAGCGTERYVAPFGKVHPDHRGRRNRFLGILVDLTERRRAETEREQLLLSANTARAEAEQASRLKDNFLASLSHELRTPMHAILGWMQMLRTGSLTDQERVDALDTIERNARLQNQLIGELLDVSRANVGKLQIDLKNVELQQVVNTAIESVRPIADSKGLRIEATIAPDVDSIPADPARLHQILGNLMSNAVKFTPPGGHITIECSVRDGHVEIGVRDSGEGIAAEHLPFIFEAFRQADGSITRRHGGLGLGLSIVQRLVQLHGGSVEARSEGLGLGAQFIVRLPQAMRTRPLFETDAPSPKSLQNGTRLAGLDLLAVDDNDDMLQLLEQMLGWEGATVRTASTGEAAVLHTRDRPPDLLILDIGMPDRHGYDLLRDLRALPQLEGRRLPAIAVTGYATVEDSARSLAAGFQAHLAKPFDMNDLFSLIEALAPPRTRDV